MSGPGQASNNNSRLDISVGDGEVQPPAAFHRSLHPSLVVSRRYANAPASGATWLG